MSKQSTPPTPDRPHRPAASSAAAAVGGQATEPGPEDVGRGLRFSLLALVLGAALTVVSYQLGLIASIASFAMAFAAVRLYGKGAGAPPRAGTIPLIGVIVVGVIVSLVSLMGWSRYTELSAEYPSATTGEVLSRVLGLLGKPEVWASAGAEALLFVAFAALGTVTTLIPLPAAWGRRPDA